MRTLPILIAAAATCIAVPASAAPLTITKTSTTVSDPMGNLIPRALPGAVVDYKILATNPLANLTSPVRNVVIVDQLPANLVLRVTDLVAGKGPVEFADGNLLGTGLLASGLTYTFTSLGSTTDGIEFWNGTTWAYQPVPDASGYDANVRGVRVTLGGTFSTLTSAQLRLRAKIR